MIKINYKLFDKELESIDTYMSHKSINEFKLKYKYLFNNIFKNIIHYKYFIKYKKIDLIIDNKNNNYINNYINNCTILDDINNYSLDNEQKRAVIIDEDNELIIAGAGSGKSLTIIGKIRYLIEYKNIKESEILCISFTKESMNSLKNKVKDNYGYNIDVLTFHKLALNIIKCFDKNIKIAPSDYLDYIVEEVLYSLNYELSNYLKKNIITFIRLFKSQGFNESYFNNIIEKNNKNKNKYLKNQNFILLKIIRCFYYIYENELRSQKMLDFDDLILYASEYVKQEGINRNYKYILIDEYQDTSFIRFKLIDEIRKCCNSKIVAVGDDFQSIYRFTGCNLDIFLNFEKYFGYTKIVKIQNTYRNSNELIKVAGDFIMKNPKQIKKKLKSNKSLDKPIKVYYYKKETELIYFLEKIYKKHKSKILLLSRNNTDIKKYLNVDYKNIVLDGDRDKISYLTVHKSKGLEEENVVLINLINDRTGFPSKIENDQILNYILTEKDEYPYAEERRLFYVALTRTKNNVYLFLNKNNESIFFKELCATSSKYMEFLN